MNDQIEKIKMFLTKSQNSTCPWCKNDCWELISSVDATLLELHENITANTLAKKSNTCFQTTDLQTNVSLRLRCKNCGCELRFDYLYILDKMKREAQSQ